MCRDTVLRSPPTTAGGWGNLMLSLEFTFALSILTDRALFFEWDSLACDLANFFEPPERRLQKQGEWGLQHESGIFDLIRGRRSHSLPLAELFVPYAQVIHGGGLYTS